MQGLVLDTSEATPVLYLYDEIGPAWIGMIDAAAVIEALAGLSGDVNVRINSPGGDVFEAAAIYNALARFPGDVIVDIDGLAASAASVIAMAGDKIRIAGNALVMIHRAWTIAMGNRTELEKVVATLDKVDKTIVDTYVARVGDKSTRDQIESWLDAETWMDAQEAVDRGFADESTDLVQGVEPVVPAGRYRHVPRGIRESRGERRRTRSDSVSRQSIAARINAIRSRLDQ